MVEKKNPAEKMMAKESAERRVEEETAWGGEMVRAGEWGAPGEAEAAKV